MSCQQKDILFFEELKADEKWNNEIEIRKKILIHEQISSGILKINERIKKVDEAENKRNRKIIDRILKEFDM